MKNCPRVVSEKIAATRSDCVPVLAKNAGIVAPTVRWLDVA